jgi:transporter family protein
MTWFVLILLATGLFALVDVTDKFLCEKRFKNIFAFGVAVNLLALIFIVGLSLFTKLSFSPGWPLFFDIISGPLYALMWVLIWQSYKYGEVSRAIAILSVSPIFSALLAILFLGERLTSLKWLAIILIVTGAIICSWEKTKNSRLSRFNPAYLLVILAALVTSIGSVISKVALSEISPLAVYIISFYASLPIFLLLLTRQDIRQEIKVNLQDKRGVLILFLRIFFSFVGSCLFYFALVSGPVSLIMTVNSTAPAFVFIYSTIISLFWPKIIKEELTKSVLISKALAIILILTGALIINS